MKELPDWLLLLQASQARQVHAARQMRKGLKTKSKSTVLLLIDTFQIFAVVYPLALVGVRIVKSLT